MMKHQPHPANIFLVLSLTFGLPLVFLTPPFQAPDEVEHFYRAVHVSQGNLVAEKRGADLGGGLGGELPESVRRTGHHVARGLAFHPEAKQDLDQIWEYLGLPLDEDQRGFQDFHRIALYSPVAHLAQGVGVWIARILGGSPLVLMYVGRLFNLSLWVSLVWTAIRITPTFRWVFMLLALTPMSLFLAASLSADTPTNALGLLWIALVLRLAVSRDRLSMSQMGVLLAVSSLLTLTKNLYLVMTLIVFAIPPERFGKRSRRPLFVGGLLALNAGLFAVWLLMSHDWLEPSYLGKHNISISGQLTYVLNHPVTYAETVARTFLHNRPGHGELFIGVLGWVDTPLPSGLIRSYWTVLFGASLIDSHKHYTLSYRQKAFMGFTFLACVLLITTVAYMRWNPVGASFINGVQGRYFIPFAPLFFLLLYNTKLDLKQHTPKFKWLLTGYLTYALSHTVWVLLHRYYVLPF